MSKLSCLLHLSVFHLFCLDLSKLINCSHCFRQTFCTFEKSNLKVEMDVTCRRLIVVIIMKSAADFNSPHSSTSPRAGNSWILEPLMSPKTGWAWRLSFPLTLSVAQTWDSIIWFLGRVFIRSSPPNCSSNLPDLNQMLIWTVLSSWNCWHLREQLQWGMWTSPIHYCRVFALKSNENTLGQELWIIMACNYKMICAHHNQLCKLGN